MSALGSNVAAAHAFNRFGLGGRPDDVVPSDPSAWLRAQIAAPDPTPVAGLPSTADGLTFLYDMTLYPAGSPGFQQAIANIVARYTTEAQTFLTNAVISPAPFRERWVWFWMNHFAVMANPYRVACCAGSYVREAIRPNATGSFVQMLQAVMAHPAMLLSLNNENSVGPASAFAQHALKANNVHLDINENLGRETLELYTVGIGANYAQADVDAMAYLLTGWTVNTTTAPRGYVYNTAQAQPGNATLMGNTYPISQSGCTAALQWLGTHPDTYQHLATKLVMHFVSDTPAPADVATIYNVLHATGGNLAAAANALISMPSAWTPLTKLRTPLDLVTAALRATGQTAATVPNINVILTALGQQIWCPVFPNGFSDYGPDWTGPEAVLLRMDYLNTMAGGLGSLIPATVAASCLGPLLSPATAAAMNGLNSQQMQFTLLFASPEFQRR